MNPAAKIWKPPEGDFSRLPFSLLVFHLIYKETTMFDVLKKSVYASIGLANVTKEKVADMVAEVTKERSRGPRRSASRHR